MQQCSSSPQPLDIPIPMQPPRPILKRSTSTPSAERHVVHFPPSPALTRTFDAYSPAAYDRSPIVVSPNVCALPERGGRTYVLDDGSSTCSARKRSPSKSTTTPTTTTTTRSLHQRALREPPSIIPSMPSLVPDLSSESDESDGFPSPNLENQEFFFGPTSQNGPKSPPDDDTVRSFLPYAPSYPFYTPVEEENTYVEKPRRRRERRNDTPSDNTSLSRTSSSDVGDEETVTPRRKSTKCRSPTSPTSPTSLSSLSDSFSSFTLNDDGCLGGF